MPETIRLSVIATPGTRPPARGFESHPRHADKTTPLRKIDPAKWPSPRGYSHAVAGTGTFVFVGGQIATDNAGRVKSVGLVAQARQALRNVRTVLAEAGGSPEHIAQMTWHVLDIDHYRARLRELGAIYREIMGSHNPAMVIVEVSALLEPAALVEIAATAILPVGGGSSPVCVHPALSGGAFPATAEASGYGTASP
ncbi:RidA family protein [Microvirga alba]|uniref:RidA family protein n=1 Tax=Microvirga alba TaxID=2791025 RepID=A0A931BUI5_9HYPH|nr:RidA family protein [Microvirga alba]MBF9235380.1 RidA family protein [Microvirga alba]